MKLCICENKSTAENIRAALEPLKESFTYRSTTDSYHSANYIITNTGGSLFNLASVSQYGKETASRTSSHLPLEKLPFYPSPFKFCINRNMKETFLMVSSLINEPSVDSIIHCGDPSGESEISLRIVLAMANNKKPIYRAWFRSQDPASIISSIQSADFIVKYDHIANAAYAQKYIDWIYATNLSKLVTLKAHDGIQYHLAILPSLIIKEIYERDKKIQEFQPTTYFGIQGHVKGTKNIAVLASKKTYLSEMLEIAEATARNYSKWSAIVTEKEENIVELPRPYLFSLSDLQTELLTTKCISPKETCEAAFSLYQKKFVSYPFTDSRFLREEEKEKIENIIKVLKESQIEDIAYSAETNTLFNNSFTDRNGNHGIIPTVYVPTKEEMDQFSSNEKHVYLAILYRFIAAFCKEPYTTKITSYTIEVGNSNAGGEDFKLESIETISKGWSLYANHTKTSPGFELKKGQKLTIDFEAIQHNSKHEGHYDFTSLINYLTNNNKESLFGITNISKTLETLCTLNYINMDTNGVLTIAEKGKTLMHYTSQLSIDVSKETNQNYLQYMDMVLLGEISTKEALTKSTRILNQQIKEAKKLHILPLNIPEEIIGYCPRCAHKIVENSKGFSCSNKSCTFVMWKNNHFLNGLKTTITRKMASELLRTGETYVMDLWSSKKNKYFDAYIRIDDTYDPENTEATAYVNYTLAFPSGLKYKSDTEIKEIILEQIQAYENKKGVNGENPL